MYVKLRKRREQEGKTVGHNFILCHDNIHGIKFREFVFTEILLQLPFSSIKCFWWQAAAEGELQLKIFLRTATEISSIFLWSDNNNNNSINIQRYIS
jgi:hypothetical protein